jgi:alanine racemase
VTNPPLYRSWCEIDQSALHHNLDVIRARIGLHPKIMCLVKADAYGHGLKPLANFFQKSDCHMLGCANLTEALLIRQAKVRLPVLLLSATLRHEIPDIVRQRFIMTLSSLEEAEALAKESRKQKVQARCHLKLNTGMNRLGIEPENILQLLSFVQNEPSLKLEGLYSHYACADTDPEFTRRQWQLFQGLQSTGLCRHICNGAGLLTLPESVADMVRPGLLVYGLSPIPTFQHLFRPALTWKARITFIRDVTRGTPLSYGATYITPRRMTVAAVAVGYGDGLFRSLSNKGSVLVNGRRCPILGRVTMDQILIDVSRAGEVKNETEVVLLGSQGKKTILASEMAADAGTIPYEITCHITERVPRLYKTS